MGSYAQKGEDQELDPRTPSENIIHSNVSSSSITLSRG